jgi:hypothetical protein
MFRLAPKTKDGYLNTMILTARAIVTLTQSSLKLLGAALLLTLLNSGRRV